MEGKYCGKCDSTKPLKCFTKRGKGLQSHCQSCMRIANLAAYYNSHSERKEAERVRSAARRRASQVSVLRYLADHPCVDCGESDVVVLEFDHVRGSKVRAVSDMMSRTWEVLEREIAKCEIRCANCHRRKTARERPNYRSC